MKFLLVLGAVLLSVLACAAPTDDATELPVPSKETPCDTAPTVGYRKETLDTVKKDSSIENTRIKTKSKEKVKVIPLKNGGFKRVIVDTSRTKTKKDLLRDEYSQSNHSLTADGVQDDTSATRDKQQHVRQVDTVKIKKKEVIITDKDGNVMSDTKKEKKKEKTKKKEENKETESLVHTVKHVPPPAPPADTVDVPPAPPADTDDAPRPAPPADTDDVPPAPPADTDDAPRPAPPADTDDAPPAPDYC